MPSEFEYAVSQLDRLESGYRRLRRRVTRLTVLVLGQGLLLLYLLLPVGRLGIPKYLEANWFVLVDGNGRVRGELMMDEGPKFQLLTDKGQERAVLYVNHDNAAGAMFLDNPASRAVLVYAYDDGAALEFHDQMGGRTGFIQSGRQPALQKIDDPAPARPGGAKP